MIDEGKHNLLGVTIDAVDYEGAVERVISAARNQKPLSVSALAVHGVMIGVLDSEQRYRLNHLDMVTPDGQPVRWALNWLYKLGLPDRVYGPILTLKICQRAATEKLPIYLYGSRQEVLNAMAGNLKRRFPELEIAGMRPSLFRQTTPEEKEVIAKEIRESGAQITFVGLGCPRQEVWVYEYRDLLSMPVLAVGAAFDFHAGSVSQAPKFMQDRGLEWFYRLVQEPRRLWRRYLFLNPLYVSLFLLQLTGLRKFDPDNVNEPRSELLYG